MTRNFKLNLRKYKCFLIGLRVINAVIFLEVVLNDYVTTAIIFIFEHNSMSERG